MWAHSGTVRPVTGSGRSEGGGRAWRVQGLVLVGCLAGVVGQTAVVMVGVEQRLGQQSADVDVGSGVEHERSFASPFDQPGEAQLGQVLADRGRGGADEFGQAGYRGLALQQRPQQFDPGRVGEHAEGLGGQVGLLLVGHGEVRVAGVHASQHTARIWLVAYMRVFAVTLASVPVTPSRWSSRWGWLSAVSEVRWALASVAAFAAALLSGALGASGWASGVLYAVCYATGGWQPAVAGLRALRARTLDVDVLMIVAALAAAAIGQVFDGALLIVIFATSGALEAAMMHRTAASVHALLQVTPERAVRLRADTGNARAAGSDEQEVAAAQLVVGDLVLVRPGERVPADGRVIGGDSEVDQAALTGEPLPVPRGVGDSVLAGTLNGTGVLRVRVQRPAAQSMLARVAAQVHEASQAKATRQLFIERVEQRYSLLVVVVTVALIGVPLLLGAQFTPTLLRAMTFMIVASPCALVLATMPPLLSVIANAGRHGVLVKNATVLERLADVDLVALDKTGTLTSGNPRVTEVMALPGYQTEEVLALAAAAEAPSEHPLARAVTAAARDRGLRSPPAEAFRAQPGRGVHARVSGLDVLVGHPVLLSHQPAAGPARQVITQVQRAGRTAVVILVDGQTAGVLALSDTVRPTARAAVATLATLTGTSPLLLTGDNRAAATTVAEQVGISDVRADLLPHDKSATVQQLQHTGRRVLLVGDGVNDAPALATADVGVAMGGAGSDLALQAADAVVVRDDLHAVPTLLALSRRARRVVIANLVFATAVITVLVAWDLLGHLPLPLGVAGHETSTVLVGLNGLRLLRHPAWTQSLSQHPTPYYPAVDTLIDEAPHAQSGSMTGSR